MKNRDKHAATHLMLCVMVVIVGACSNPTRHSIPRLDNGSTDIVQDLSLADGDTVVIQMTQTDLNREELGLRDEAVVMTENNGKFTLRYVYRFPQSRKLNFRRWRLWVNYEPVGDGTAAEVAAIKEYAQRPHAEQIAEFRADILNHWSNR
jgi:hypothetical protein